MQHWKRTKPADKGGNAAHGTEACLWAARGGLKRRHPVRRSKPHGQGKAERGLSRKVLINCGFVPTGCRQTIPCCPLAHKALGGLRCERDTDKVQPLRGNPQWKTRDWKCWSMKTFQLLWPHPNHWCQEFYLDNYLFSPISMKPINLMEEKSLTTPSSGCRVLSKEQRNLHTSEDIPTLV